MDDGALRLSVCHEVVLVKYFPISVRATALSEVTPSPSSAAQRRAQRRATRVDNRYHSGNYRFSFS